MQPAIQPQAPAGGFQNGGWYGGKQYWNGQFGTPGQIINPNQQGTGQQVSNTVAAQTNPNNPAYIASLNGNQPNNNGTTPGNSSLPTPSAILGGLNLGAPKAPNLGGLYDQYYTNNPDVIAGNKSITDLQGQVTTRQQARDQAEKDINDNPFYAEATRVGKINQLNTEANNDLKTLNDQLTTAQTNISNQSAEAQRRVNLAQGQYTLENEAWKQNLDEFNTLISQGALENASPQTIAGLSVSTGIPTDMLNSIVTSEQAKNIQLITGQNGVVSGINAKTGQVVFNSQVGASSAVTGGKSGKSAGGKVDQNGYAKDDYIAFLVNDIKNGITLKSLMEKYKPYISVDDIYNYYALNSTKWGAPKETLPQAKAGQFSDMPGFKAKAVKPNIQ